jgi:hypothetical protein
MVFLRFPSGFFVFQTKAVGYLKKRRALLDPFGEACLSWVYGFVAAWKLARTRSLEASCG